MERIYCPINIDNRHWTLIVIYIKNKKICYYDSMVNHRIAERYMLGALQWIQDEAHTKGGPPNFDIKQWTTVKSPENLPQQSDTNSCGVFVSAFAALLTDDISLNKFTQDYANFFRRKICLDILNLKICLPDNPSC